MQKFVSIYSLAAHLAILAVAPLFLYPFAGTGWVAAAVLWLSLFAAFWVVMEPARLRGEMPHDARERVLYDILHDPFLYLLLALVVLTGIRALNGGIAMAYDLEAGRWIIRPPSVEFLPGSTADAGGLEFAAAVALTVLVMGCRHALAKRARTLVLMFMSLFAGIGGYAAAVAWCTGHAEAVRLVTAAGSFVSYSGVAFALYFIAGIFALGSAFENGWRGYIGWSMLGVSGSALGAFLFAPSSIVMVAAIAAAVALAIVAVRTVRMVSPVAMVKLLLAVAAALVLPAMGVMNFMPHEQQLAKIGAFVGQPWLDEGTLALRSTLSDIAIDVWKKHLWIGSGLGSVPLQLRFAATPELWKLMPSGPTSVMNGWCALLMERGIFGVVLPLVALGFMFYGWIRRLVDVVIEFVRGSGELTLAEAYSPMAVLPLVALTVPVVSGFFDSSFIRPDVVLALGAFFAVGAGSFRRIHRETPADEGGEGVAYGR